MAIPTELVRRQDRREKTAPEEQAGAARSTDRRETRGMSLYLSVYDTIRRLEP